MLFSHILMQLEILNDTVTKIISLKLIEIERSADKNTSIKMRGVF